MNKKMVLIFIAGWLLAFVFPPQSLLGMAKGGGQQG